MDLLITVLSLLAAVYAIMPRVMQLSLAVKVTFPVKLSLTLALLVTLYLSYYKFFERHGCAVSSDKWPPGLDPEKAAPLVLLVAIIILVAHQRYGSFAPRQIHKFAELAQDLLWMGSMADLVALIDKNVDGFFDILNQNYWQRRLRDWLVPPVSFETMVGRLEKTSRKEPNLLFPRARRQLVRILPDYSEEQIAAAELANTVLLSDTFITALASMRPYLAVTILQSSKSRFEREKFLERYIKALTNNSISIFYAELAASEAISEERWAISSNSRLLRYFFDDIKVAEKLAIWRPIGNIAVRHIKDLKANPEKDPYNSALWDFDGPEGRRTLIPTVMHFFDIMVREAFAQGLTFHMWLFYIQYIVEAMVENYCPRGDIDQEAEFPVRYSRLIYDAFSILEHWIALVEYAPLDQPNAVFNGDQIDLSNIPKSSIVALSRCLFATTMALHLEEKFKALLAKKVFHLYFRLCDVPGRKDYANALILSLVEEAKGRDSRVYVGELYKTFREERDEYRMSNADEDDMARIDNALSAGR
jgi:hypothetical protein